jgi:hypothetical protein
MNKLGEKGLYTTESKKRMKEEQNSRTREIAELQAQVEALTAERDNAIRNATSTKNVDVKINLVKDELESAEKKPKAAAKDGAKVDSDQSNEKGGKTAKRKRGKKVKKEEEETDEEDDDDYAKPAKKSRTKKANKEEEADDDDDDYTKPAKKSRAKKFKKEKEPEIVKEEVDNSDAIVAPKKRAARGKKAVKEEIIDEQASAIVSPEVKPKASTKTAVKKEEIDELNGLDETAEHPKTKGNGKKGGKKAVKQESPETSPSTLKGDPSESSSLLASMDPAPKVKTYAQGIRDGMRDAFEAALAAGETEDDFEAFVEEKRAASAASQTKKRGGRAKKA